MYMPFKSKAQRRFFYAAEDRGDLPEGTAARWEEHTPKGKKLPEKRKKMESKTAADVSGLIEDSDLDLDPGEAFPIILQRAQARGMTPSPEFFWALQSECERMQAKRNAISKIGHIVKEAVTVGDATGFLGSATAPLSNTIGRVLNIPQAIMLGTTKGITDTTSPSSIAPLIRAYQEDVEKDLPALTEESKNKKGRFWSWLLGNDPRGMGELHVSAGSPEVLKNLGRVWTNPGNSIISRLLGTASVPLSGVLSSLFRADHYNPFSHSVTSFTNEPAVQAHELGHAKHFSQIKSPLLGMGGIQNSSFGALAAENQATKYGFDFLNKVMEKYNANPKELSPEEKAWYELANTSRANRILGGGMGSYIISLPGALVGQLVGALAKPWGEIPEMKRVELINELKSGLEVSKSEEEAKKTEKEFKNKVINMSNSNNTVPLAKAAALSYLLNKKTAGDGKGWMDTVKDTASASWDKAKGLAGNAWSGFKSLPAQHQAGIAGGLGGTAVGLLSYLLRRDKKKSLLAHLGAGAGAGVASGYGAHYAPKLIEALKAKFKPA
jgi:hypothetical protein